MDEVKSAHSERYGMGTVISSKVFGRRADEAIKAAEEEIVRLEGLLSRFIPDSEISRINNSAGGSYTKVSDETFEVLSRAAEFSKLGQGCFDVTVGPLVDLWRRSKGESRTPDRSDILQLLPLVDYTSLALDIPEKAVRLERAGQSIDLGGIGKGYAADLILEVFKKYGISSAFTNFGGNVAAIGSKPDGAPWRIGIRHPRKDNSLAGVVTVAGKSVVTSGDYQRYFIGIDGNRYHHIMDPSTGYPAESGLISASIITDSSVAADAISTIIFVAGMKKGLELLKSFQGTEAVFIDRDLKAYVTRGLKDCFQVCEGIEMEILD